MFSSEYCEIFKTAYFEELLLRAASDFLKKGKEHWWAAAFVLTLLLSRDNLLPGYEQLSYEQVNRNLSICVSLAKNWFMLHKKFNQDLTT